MTSIPTQEQQTVPIPSPQFEEANSSSLQDSSVTGTYVCNIMMLAICTEVYTAYSHLKSLFFVGERPTMIELIRFRGRSRRINIPLEISTKYYQFGVLLLKDETGARIGTIIHKHMNNSEQINHEILEQWIAGKGEEPVTWGTLVEVLQDVELTELASDIADVKLS